MNIKELLNSESFSKIGQVRRRRLVEKYILTEKDCKPGTIILCFENEVFTNDYGELFLKYYNFKPQKIASIKIGSEYSIISYKDKKVKIINDTGKKHWYTIDRFLYSLKIERKEKIKNIEKNKT